MKTVIVCSLNDPAGKNIRDRLLESYPFKAVGEKFDSSDVYSWDDKIIVSSRKDIVFVDKLDETFGECRYVFLSRHRAESGIPSLTAHFTGNFGSAAFGGNPGQIAKYSPRMLKNYLIGLDSWKSEIPNSYNITLEATHHGPTALQSPLLFVELGTTEREWSDQRTAETIAKALIVSLESEKKYEKCAVGIGGTHYPEKLNKILLQTEIAIGPIVPKHALEFFNKQMLDQMVSKSDQKVEFVIVDEKGLGKYKQDVLKVLDGSTLERIAVGNPTRKENQ
jgi:D-aminoacyl-tRNA deacylase